MASLSHVKKDGRNCWVLRAYINKKRVSISLGPIDELRAQEALQFIEHLIERKGAGKLPDRKAYKWLDEIDTDLHDRLSKYELITARRLVDRPTTILAFFRDYIKERTDWKKPQNYSQAVDHLEKFLGKDLPLAALTKGDSERWHRWMIAEGLSPNTAGQNVKRCRQMLWAAVSDELIEKNPMEGVKVSSDSDQSKDHFVDRESYDLILEHCPNSQWRVMVALTRIGGLRCPSEVLALRWNDINWDRGRFKVTSPKTAKSGKASRIVPLFPELRNELEKLYSEVGPGINVPIDSPVITIRKSSACNLRTQLNRIVELASIKTWAKPFMAMRSSRRTELERSGKHPNHVLNSWLGHSRNIAEKHYLKVLEADFEAALVPLSHSLSHQPVGNTPHDTDKSNEKRALMGRDGQRWEREYTQLDSNK